jgi:hypothetical protein
LRNFMQQRSVTKREQLNSMRSPCNGCVSNAACLTAAAAAVTQFILNGNQPTVQHTVSAGQQPCTQPDQVQPTSTCTFILMPTTSYTARPQQQTLWHRARPALYNWTVLHTQLQHTCIGAKTRPPCSPATVESRLLIGTQKGKATRPN